MSSSFGNNKRKPGAGSSQLTEALRLAVLDKTWDFPSKKPRVPSAGYIPSVEARNTGVLALNYAENNGTPQDPPVPPAPDALLNFYPTAGVRLDLAIDVAYNGSNLWVATGHEIEDPSKPETGSLVYSSNGSNWLRSTNGVDGQYFIPKCIYYANGLWVTGGLTYDEVESSAIKYSTDGSNWSNSHTILNDAPDGYVPGLCLAISHDGNKWVAVGNSNMGILMSLNGRDWQYTVNDKIDGGWESVDHDTNGNWVVVGKGIVDSNTIRWSPNGIQWSNVTGSMLPVGDPYSIGRPSVRYGNGIWVSTGIADNYISTLYSSNGSNWLPTTGSQFSYNGNGVAYGNGRWVAVGANAPAGTANATNILTSSNGSNWETTTGDDFEGAGLNIKYYSNVWVATGVNSLTNTGTSVNMGILVSSDGTEWSKPGGSELIPLGLGLAHGNGKWVVVGGNEIGTNKPTIVVSQ